MGTCLYALLEARTEHPNIGRPFYIGIGTKKRPYKHLAQARHPKGHHNSRLHEVLQAHISAGVDPGVVIIGTFATKNEAGEAEKAEIAKWGRAGIEPNGILCNLAAGGQGPDAELMRLPEVRERNAEAQRNVSPEAKAARIAALTANRANPEVEIKRRANSGAPQKASWADPEIRARRVAAMKGKRKTKSAASDAARRANAQKGRTVESNSKQSEASRQRWADPEFRAAMAEKKRKAWQDPEARARMLAGRSEGIAKSWQDPAVRARRIGGIKSASVDSVEREGEHGGDSP